MKSQIDFPMEVIVVDNNSVDDSVNMVEEKYPSVQLIKNQENVGFSKANNQGIEQSQGEFVLLLNPDTAVAEDSFSIVVSFMESHADCGGLGVRMIDGKGQFLPESKRGLPTPMVAFYKIFGLSSLFPKSEKFSRYHLGHLSEHENHTIDILSGAFMLMRKEALNKVGVLDEDFFMYGEDVDLSYRITQGGYKNYYCSDTSIIHYKGESTKKSSVNYVFVFYNAMIIFAKKHFTGNQAALFSLAINFAIYLRAFFAILVRFIKQIFLPFIDFAYVVAGMFALTNYWEMANIEFPASLINYSIPIYAATWLIVNYFNGSYDPPVRLFKYVKGVFIGTVLILIAYAILPKSLQFSRLFIFVGAGWVLSYYFISRLFLHFAIGKRFKFKLNTSKNFAIVAREQEFERIKTLLHQTNDKVGNVVFVHPEDRSQLKTHDIDEIIFSALDVSYFGIIESMNRLKNPDLDFKIAPENANYLIGSNSIDTAGDLYVLNVNTLVSKENKRKKRLFDFLVSLFLIALFPFSFFLFRSPSNYLKNLISVFLAKRTFIGFSESAIQRDVRLPKIKQGILSPSDALKGVDQSVQEKLNVIYARDYSMRNDFGILIKAWRKLEN